MDNNPTKNLPDSATENILNIFETDIPGAPGAPFQWSKNGAQSTMDAWTIAFQQLAEALTWILHKLSLRERKKALKTRGYRKNAARA